MKNFIFYCFFSLLCSFHSTAQSTKNTQQISQLWLANTSLVRLSNKWELLSDLHLRTKENFANNFSVSIIRLGLNYYITPSTKFTAGFAWVNLFAGDNHKNITDPELRPWQQLQWMTKYGKNKTIQHIRLEERFRRKILNDVALAEGYNFNFRLRYNLLYEVPLSKNIQKPGAFSFVAFDEIFVNFGKEVINNYFDQNRFFVGLKLQTSANTNLLLGYQNVFQQLAAGNQYKNINGLRATFYQNIDLRGKW